MKIYDNNNNEILFNGKNYIDVDDNSYRYRAIRGEDTLTLYFQLEEHVEIPVGATCEFPEGTGQIYTLFKPENLKMEHSRKFEYTIVFEAEEAKASRWKFKEVVIADTPGTTGTVGGSQRLKFSLTGKPREHLEMFVANMNLRDFGGAPPERNGWSVGQYIDAPEKSISYNHTYCKDALEQMANEFETEYEFEKVHDGIGKQVSLCKVEHYRDNPLELSYGKGKGFKPGVGRTNFQDSVPVEILYVQGGERNIDFSKYGNKELLLPRNQTLRFDGQNFDDDIPDENLDENPGKSKVRTYITDDAGLSIRRDDKELASMVEDSLDCPDVYPSRVGNVTKVRWDWKGEEFATYTEAIDAGAKPNEVFCDIFDSTIPDGLNYAEVGEDGKDKWRIAGERATIIFQSGMLAGKEFEILQSDTSLSDGYIHTKPDGTPERRFKLVTQEIDGLDMPGGAFSPSATVENHDGTVGDKYAVFNVSLPSEYICDDDTKSGAEWDMFRQGVKYLYDNEEAKFSFTGELDGKWAKDDWLNIGGHLRLGGFVEFSDPRFQQEGIPVRIVGIKEFINNPHSPEIELSNSPVSGSVSSALKKIESNEVVVDDLHKDALQFTKRRYRDAQEAMKMLNDAMLEGFTAGISPATVQTMMMFLGSQFRFVVSETDSTPKPHNVDIDRAGMTVSGGTILHIEPLGNSAGISRCWTLPGTPLAFDDPENGYYLYAKVKTEGTAGKFRLSPAAISKNDEEEDGYYHFLVGIVGSEYDGIRSYTPLTGHTEILPGQVITDVIRSQEGDTYFDLQNNEIVGRINFRDGLVSGDIAIKGESGGIVAGINGDGDSGDSIRFYAGSTKENKEVAPFKVLQDGSLEATRAKITGEINATKGSFKNVAVEGSVAQPWVLYDDAAVPSQFTGDANGIGRYDNIAIPTTSYVTIDPSKLSWNIQDSGRTINICQYRWGADISSFDCILTAPTGKYFFENGKQYKQLRIARELITLVGYGTPSTFYGWIVQNRTLVMPSGTYGAYRRILYQGYVWFNSLTDYEMRLWSADLHNGSAANEDWGIEKMGTGRYKITLPIYLAETSWVVYLHNTNCSYSGPKISDIGNVPRFATLNLKSNENITGVGRRSFFEVITADDYTPNDGPFMFEVVGSYDWIGRTPETRSSEGANIRIIDSSQQ